MKKLVSACLCMTLHFVLDRRLPIKDAKAKVREEVEEFRKSLDDTQIIYDEVYNDDGSVILYIRKKVKDIPPGAYFKKNII